MFSRYTLKLLALPAIVISSVLILIPSGALAAPVDIARTGQTDCYNNLGQLTACAGTGQDGEYMAGVPWPELRFSDNGDGTISDTLSGLIWLKKIDCINESGWLNSLTATNALANGTCGLTDGSVAGDWRMPNYLELISTPHLGVANFIAWLESFGFTGMTGHGFFSSTTTVQNHSSFLGFQLNDRVTGSLLKSGGYKTWPVKGVSTGPASIWKTGQTTCHGDSGTSNTIPCAGTGQDGELQTGVPHPTPRFTDNNDGTVTDNLTNLVWLKNASCFDDRIWLDAVSDAINLSTGDCGLSDGSSTGDWRLPNALELVSLSDFSQSAPTLTPGHPFTGVLYRSHWTSTTWPKLSSYAYYGSPAGQGGYMFAAKTNTAAAWPVRGKYERVELIYADGFE